MLRSVQIAVVRNSALYKDKNFWSGGEGSWYRSWEVGKGQQQGRNSRLDNQTVLILGTFSIMISLGLNSSEKSSLSVLTGGKLWV
jgi:hypothetical protein